MKKTIRTLFLIVSLVSVLACKKDTRPVLYLYNWTYYTPDSVIEKFEHEFNVKVVYDDYASNEDMFSKLRAGAVGYDIVVPSSDFVSIMMKLDMLEKIDRSQIPNSKYIRPFVTESMHHDPNMDYSIPYFLGAPGVAVNTKQVPQFEKNWNIFARTDLRGRMTMIDDLRDVFGAALATNGHSVNTTNRAEIEAAFELINSRWKPNLVKFDSDAVAKSFAAGDFWVVQGYAESIFEELPESMIDDVVFFIPDNVHSPMYLDNLCIPKGAKNIELAHQFINFFLRPEIYAEFLDDFGFPSTVHATADQFMQREPLYRVEALKNCELQHDIGAALEIYSEYWERIRFTD